METEDKRTVGDEHQPMATNVDNDSHNGDVEDENMGVPTDKGYSWVIVLCTFLCSMINLIHNVGTSTLFVDISDEFQASTTMATLTFTCFTFSSGISNLITSNVILGRLNARTICVVSAFFNGMLTILMSRSPNVIVWLCLNTVKGVFSGAMIVPPISLIGYYFKKKRSFASALRCTANVIGFMVIPPFTSFLRLQYGLRGTLLIFGAIEWHVMAISILMRPPSSYRNLYLRRQKTSVKTMHANGNNNQGKQPESPAENNRFLSPDKSDIQRLRKKLSPDMGPFSLGTRINSTESVSSSIHLGASISGSMLDIFPVGVPAVEDDALNKEIQIEYNTDTKTGMFDTKRTQRSTICRLSTFIDTSLFKLWRFRMLITYMSLSASTNFVMSYLPAIAIRSGIGKTDAALLLTIAGCMDFFVRVFTGFIADKHWIKMENLIIGSLTVIAVITQFSRYFTTYPLFATFSFVFGVFAGFRQNLFYPLLLEYFGPDKTPKALGISVLFITSFLSTNHPVIGALADATGSFDASLHYVGAVVLISTFILLCNPIAKRWDEENRMKAAEAGRDELKNLTRKDEITVVI